MTELSNVSIVGQTKVRLPWYIILLGCCLQTSSNMLLTFSNPEVFTQVILRRFSVVDTTIIGKLTS